MSTLQISAREAFRRIAARPANQLLALLSAAMIASAMPAGAGGAFFGGVADGIAESNRLATERQAVESGDTEAYYRLCSLHEQERLRRQIEENRKLLEEINRRQRGTIY